MTRPFHAIIDWTDAEDWDDCIAGIADRPFFASRGWGIYKTLEGWAVRRFSLTSADGATIAAAQIQSRRAGPFSVRLVQGGPVLASGALAEPCIEALLPSCKTGLLSADLLYPAQTLTDELEKAMLSQGFRALPASDSETVLLDLSMSTEALRRSLSKNWRHNLKRAEKNELEVRWVPSEPGERHAALHRFSVFYDDLVTRKGFKRALDPERVAICLSEDSALDILEVARGGEIVASRAVWHGGRVTLDLLAASDDGARKTYANYLALWAAILRAKERGAKIFDCGGIDPYGNVGVYNFKKGLSGRPAGYGRLWLRVRPRCLWPLVAWQIGVRR